MQIFTVALLLSVASFATAGNYYGGFGFGGGAGGHYGGHHFDYYSYPEYKFEYGVKDAHTGDHKDQWEQRHGDQVKGAYTLHEADGTKRIVEYHADKHNGFNAVVKRVGHAHHPQHYHHYGHGYGYGNQQGYGHGYGHAESYANLNQHHHHY